MLEPDVKDYLDTFKKDVAVRLGALEREASETRRNQLSEDDMERVFRQASGRMNYITRIAVAVIAALAVIGNGLTMVLGNHYTLKAEVCCASVTDRKIEKAELRNQERDRAIAADAVQKFWQSLRMQGLVIEGKQP